MVQVANLAADLTTNTSRFESGFKRANTIVASSTSGWAKSLSGVDRQFNTMGAAATVLTGGMTRLYAAVAAVAGGGALGALINSNVKAAAAIDDTAKRLQISTDALQSYQFAAAQSGLETGTLETALTKLNAQIADGALKYSSTTEAMDSIAEAVKNAKTDIERATIVNDVFGAKLGAKLLPVLTGGAQGLRDFGDEAQRTGNIISGDVIQAAAEFDDKMTVLGMTIKNNFSAGFLKELTDGTGDLRDVYTDPNFSEGMERIGALHGALAGYMVDVLANANKLIKAYAQLNVSVGDYLDQQAKTMFSPLAEKYDNWITGITGRARKGAEVSPAPPEGIAAGVMPPVPGQKPAGAGPIVPYSPPKKPGGAGAKTPRDEAAALLEGLRAESEELAIQTEMYGKKESAIDRAVRMVKIENQLKEQGIKLTADQSAQLDAYLTKIEYQSELQTVQAEKAKELEEAERARAQAVKEFGDGVIDSLQEAIDAGGDLSDVLKKLALDIAKLALNSAQFRSLFEGNAGGTASGGGGFLSGILGGLFKSAGSFFGGGAASGSTSQTVSLGASQVFPSHASGIDMVSRDTLANIHKGEAVLNPQDANKWRRGDSNGITIGTLDARGAERGVGEEIRNVMRQVENLRRQVPTIAVSSIKEANKRDPRLLNV